MAEIESFIPRISPDGARRLSASLTEVLEQGGTGPRGAHIRSLGLSLEMLVEALRRELVRVGAGDDLDGYLTEVERLATLARSYLDPDSDSAPNAAATPVR